MSVKELKLSSKPITSNSFDSDGTSFLVVGGERKIALVISKEVPVHTVMTSAMKIAYGSKVQTPKDEQEHVLHLNAYSCSTLTKAVEAMKSLRCYEGSEDCYIKVPERLEYACQLTLQRLGFKGSRITQEVVEECLMSRPAICIFEQEVKTLAGYFA
jgi:hypothetical protein